MQHDAQITKVIECLANLISVIEYSTHLYRFFSIRTRDASILLGAVHKRRPQSGGRGLSSTNNFRTRREGVIQMWMSALLV